MVDSFTDAGPPPLVVSRGRRQWWLWLGIAGVVMMIVAVAAVAWFFLYRSAVPDTETGGTPQPSLATAPAQDTQSTVPDEEQAAVTPSPGEALSTPPAVTGQVTAIVQPSLVVSVRYVRAAVFDLDITRVARSVEIPTVGEGPAAGQPYSVLQVISASGQVIGEHRFSMPTEVFLDGVETGTGDPLYKLPESALTLVVPAGTGEQPRAVRIVTAQGHLLSERSFVYGELPQEVASPSPSPLSRVRSWLTRVVGSVWAASGTFNIAVINQPGADGSLVVAKNATDSLVENIEPWKKHSGNIVVTALPNTVNLNCAAIVVPGFPIQFPSCSDSGTVRREVLKRIPDVDAIVVVVNTACNCGTAFIGSGIAAVGTGISGGVIGHEMGHATGSLTEEYYGDRGLQGPPGPNCFGSATSCEAAIAPYAGESSAQCTVGCNNPASFRPSNRLMYNKYDVLEYGPFEECIMEEKIAAVLGVPAGCDSDTDDGLTLPGREYGFYGGRR